LDSLLVTNKVVLKYLSIQAYFALYRATNSLVFIFSISSVNSLYSLDSISFEESTVVFVSVGVVVVGVVVPVSFTTVKSIGSSGFSRLYPVAGS
jgi:hypothetical protein